MILFSFPAKCCGKVEKKLVLRMHVAATAIRYWDNCTCCQSTTLFPDIEDSSCYFHYCKVSWLTSGLGVVWPRWPRLPRQDRSVRRLQTRCSQPELQRIVPWVSPRRKVNLTKNSDLLKIFNFFFLNSSPAPNFGAATAPGAEVAEAPRGTPAPR